MNFARILNFYKKYQVSITLSVGTILFIISTFWGPAIFIAGAFVLLSYVFSSIENIFAYTFYFMLFTSVIIFYIVIAVGAFLIVFIKYAIDCHNKKVKFYKYPFIASTVIVVIYSLIHYNIDKNAIFQGVFYIAIFYLIYVMFCYRKQLSLRKMFLSLFAGIFVTAILSLIFYYVPSSKIFVFNDWNSEYIYIKDQVFLVTEEYRRLELLTYHPNHLASFCLFLMAYNIYEYINGSLDKKDKILNAIMFIVAVVVGILTLSKAFFIVLLIEVGYILVYVVQKYKKKSLKFVIPIVVIALAIYLIFRNQITVIWGRMFPDETSTSLNDMTTGRLDLWKMYLSDIVSSPLKLIFGKGFFSAELVNIGPHSFYVALLYRFGIVGILMLLGLAYTYYISYDKKFKFDFKNILPIIVLAIYSIQEANLDERILLVVTSIMFVFSIECDSGKLISLKTDNLESNPRLMTENITSKPTLTENNMMTENVDNKNDNHLLPEEKSETKQNINDENKNGYKTNLDKQDLEDKKTDYENQKSKSNNVDKLKLNETNDSETQN